MILKTLILLHVFPFTVATQRIECRWGQEFLCGNRCLINDRTCFCGNETMTYSDNYDFYCCTHENCFLNYEGDVVCHGGERTLWNKACGDNCAQNARTGWTMRKCQYPNTCYLSPSSCNGMSMCEE